MSETEKITINLGVVDLGKIDLLVEQGFYTNRTDFIRNSIRSGLDKHAVDLSETIARKNFIVGILLYDAKDLEKRRAKGVVLDIQVIGALLLSSDISPELANATINSVKVFGVFDASDEVKEALGDKIISQKLGLMRK